MKNLLVIGMMSLSLMGCLSESGGGASAPAARIAQPDQPIDPVLTTPTTLVPDVTVVPPTTTLPPSPTTTTTTTIPAGPYTFGGGQGTFSQPYLVQNADDVNHIRDYPAAFYKINNPIDMSTISNFAPIPTFSGTIYGGYYQITNLKMNYTGTGTAAFVQTLTGTLTQMYFNNAEIHGSTYATGLTGRLDSTSVVTATTFRGSVFSPSGGTYFLTGVMGPLFINSIYLTRNSASVVQGITYYVYINGSTVSVQHESGVNL